MQCINVNRREHVILGVINRPIILFQSYLSYLIANICLTFKWKPLYFPLRGTEYCFLTGYTDVLTCPPYRWEWGDIVISLCEPNKGPLRQLRDSLSAHAATGPSSDALSAQNNTLPALLYDRHIYMLSILLFHSEGKVFLDLESEHSNYRCAVFEWRPF